MMALDPITLDPGDPGPIYLQIATRLRSAIATGALSSGARLPSARTLSAQLGVAQEALDLRLYPLFEVRELLS